MKVKPKIKSYGELPRRVANKVSHSCPCQDCNDRYATCHGECQKYLSWKNHTNTLNGLYKKKKLELKYGA